MAVALLIGLAAFGYLCGSVPFGVIVSKIFAGRDVRQAGSGNIGATNVARVVGKKLGALVLVLDALKGALPVFLSTQAVEDPVWHGAVGLAAFLGHVFPVWLRFKGGKGVATALGVLLVLVPFAALAGAAVWLAIVATVRVSSVGSLLGGIVAVAVAFATADVRYGVLTATFLALMLFTHRANLLRLWSRKENRV